MIRDYLKAGSGQVLQAAFGLLVLGALTRVLGPREFGSYVVLSTVLVLATTAVSAGAQSATLVMSAQDPEYRSELHGQVAITSMVSTVGAILVALVAADEIAAWIVPGSGGIVVAETLLRLPLTMYTSLIGSELIGAGKIGRAALLSLATSVSAVLSPAAATLGANHLEGAVAGALAASAIAALAAAMIGVGTVGFRLRIRAVAWARAWKVAAPLHLGTLAYWVLLRSDALAVNALLGGASTGVYGLALGLSERIGVLTSPIYTATASRVSGADRVSGLKTVLAVARVEFAFACVASIAAVVLGPTVIALVAGDGYGASVAPFAILVFGAAVLPIWSALGLWLVTHAQGAWWTARLQILVALITVPGYWVATAAWGLVGPALVSTVAYLLLVAFGLRAIRRTEGLGARDFLLMGADTRALRDLAQRALRKRQR